MLLALGACAPGVTASPGTAMATQNLALIRHGQPPCEALGAATYLGQGRFVTASHVVDGVPARLRGCAPSNAAPLVVFAGRAQPAGVQRIGLGHVAPDVGLRYQGGLDLALLQARTPDGPGASPCGFDATPGQAVVVATPRRIVPARVIGQMREETPIHGGYTEIAIRLEPGESGAGVFDAEQGCLVGVVANRDVARPDRTRIVLTQALRAFLALPAPIEAPRVAPAPPR
ncbi:trypsin-like peptidase domain-containing protein [Humitalea sp. 24SJ18S-53]|uniref:trypsin-like peptidase domain-containing protein n=1 Tax=Humitalea sp. 24SJ18S-53 TaxID=3422307 RepID=UPI003D664A6A